MVITYYYNNKIENGMDRPLEVQTSIIIYSIMQMPAELLCRVFKYYNDPEAGPCNCMVAFSLTTSSAFVVFAVCVWTGVTFLRPLANNESVRDKASAKLICSHLLARGYVY